MRNLISISIVLTSILISVLIVQAQAPDITYPVKELGNCKDETSCRNFCEVKENMIPCINFAEQQGLISKEEAKRAKSFAQMGEGPGGCRDKDECEMYCNDITHIDECIAFGEENGLIPPEELEEAKKVQAAIRRGVIPPPCGNKRQCDVYCDEPEHMEECIAFGIEAGFIQGQELEDVQKMLTALKRGVKPPPCRGKEACDEYCSNPDNMELCMNFAMEAGFMNEQEKADSQKMLAALKKGIRPPNCRGKEECDVYCSQDEHFEECTKFAEAAGFMTAEEAEMARKTGGKGPGGCMGREECEAFCNNPDNQETCFNFGKEHGMIPEEDLKMMEEGRQRFKESFNQMPPEVADCLKSLVGEEMFEKFKTGAVMPPREIGDQMRTCFEQFKPQPPEGIPGPPEGMPLMPPAGMCGWCGDNCIKIEPEVACPAVMPPAGYICIEENGACTTRKMGEGMVPPPGFEGQMPPEGFILPEGMMMPPEGWQEGQMPPEGMMMPPDGTMPPAGMQMPPSGGEMMPPPPSGESAPPPPTSFGTQSLMGIILGPFLDIFR